MFANPFCHSNRFFKVNHLDKPCTETLQSSVTYCFWSEWAPFWDCTPSVTSGLLARQTWQVLDNNLTNIPWVFIFNSLWFCNRGGSMINLPLKLKMLVLASWLSSRLWTQSLTFASSFNKKHCLANTSFSTSLTWESGMAALTCQHEATTTKGAMPSDLKAALYAGSYDGWISPFRIEVIMLYCFT